MIEDLDSVEIGAASDCEICIIGSGPVGLSIALEFAGRRERVIVLESGGDAHETKAEALSEFQSVGQKRAHPSAVRRRIFGGTSSVWSGRCVPFSPIDFQQRAWIPKSGWPIAAEEVVPYLDRAGKVLQMGPAVFDDRIWSLLGISPADKPWDPATFETQVFQASVVRSARTRDIPPPVDPDSKEMGALQHSSAPQAEDVAEFSRKTLESASNIRVLLHAHATQVLTDESGSSVTGVRVQSLRGKTLAINARRVVLACGAIDNARLLLLSRARNPAGLGNDHDQVGRFLTDHHYAPVATIAGAQAHRLRRRLGYRWLDIAGTRHVYVTGVSLAAQRQREDGLSRATLFLFEHAARKSALSSVGQILAGMRTNGEGASQSDWSNALRHPFEVAQGAWDRYFRGLPPLTPVSGLDVGCNVEQIPNPDSRVTLGSPVDFLGQPVARLDWRLDQREYETYCATAKLFVQECARLGLEVPQITAWAQGQDAQWRSSLHDMAHPMCTTRMSADPRLGVVDANCAVHGVRGLYVAGSSVFATGGTSNPTLTAVSLAIRLADHLRAASDSVAPELATDTRIELVNSPRVRVGVVGTGNRVRSMYGPVLAACSESIEVVGFVGRGAEGIARVAGESGWSPFESIGTLVSTGKPDFLIVAVSDSANAHVMRQGLSSGLPVLGETPLAWSEKEGRSLVGLAQSRGLPFGICEQFPFLPAERLKAKLIELGAIGAVISCHNDFATYSYHGIAQLRAYMGYGRPVIAVRARNHKFGRTGTPDGLASANDSLAVDETWQLATFEVAGGGLMEHRYSDGFAALPTRPKGTLRVFGNCGYIEGERMVFVDRTTGAKFEAAISRELGSGRVQAVGVVHPTLGDVSWRYTPGTNHLSDEQVAVWSHVDTFRRAVRYGGAPLYTGRQALEDIEIMRAMGYSAGRDGARVRLPLRSEFEKAKTAAHKARRRK